MWRNVGLKKLRHFLTDSEIVRMKQSHALAYLRQICCSGLSREVAITEFLKSVPLLITSNSNTFSVGERGLIPHYHLAGFDLAEMSAVAPKIIAQYHTPQRQARAMAWFSQHPIIDNPKIMEESFYLTDLYQQIYLPFDMHHLLWAPLMLGDKNAGVLGLYRPRHQKPFDSRDQAHLLGLLPYLAHAYAAVNDVNFDSGADSHSGMLVMDTQGSILFQSPEAKALLEQARYPRLLNDQRRHDRLMQKLAALCHNLLGIYRGENTPPPSFVHTGPNGQFVFRAYWLNAYDQGESRMIGVTIEYFQPLTLKILRALRDLPLSPSQKEVALLLAQDVSFEQIAQRLHIKPTTVKDHVGKIYSKLDIHQRDELLPWLLNRQVNK
jgi:DNA-binding CsgD family transcriptional regulator